MFDRRWGLPERVRVRVLLTIRAGFLPVFLQSMTVNGDAVYVIMKSCGIQKVALKDEAPPDVLPGL